jgi:hypothetical protein
MGDEAELPAPAWWDDLGDDELLRRLCQRGVRYLPARALVRDRDWSDYARGLISDALAR